MTRRELVKAAIGHRDAERIPYLIDFCPDAWESMLPRANGMDQGRFVDNDVESFSPVWWGWGALEPDWKGFDPPRTPDHVKGIGSYAELYDGMKRARDTTDKYILLRIYGSHFEKAYFARGIEGFLADMAGSPEFARRFLTRIIDRNLVMLETMLTTPEVDGVLLGSDWGSQQDLLMSPDSWEELIRPGEQREYDLIHAYGKDVWIHSCGNVEKIIPSLLDMGVDVLNPVQPEAMDIGRLKSAYGNRLTFWGGLSTQQTLPFGTPAEVREECRAVKSLLGRGGGLIFSPAQSIQSDVSVDNIMALLEIAREANPA